jgi:hypothetical protein
MLHENDRMSWRGFVWVGFVLLGLQACTTPNPRSCADGLCTDQRFPFCDVAGDLGGTPNECIAVTCTPGEFAECRGDTAVICNATGNDFDLVECQQGCDAASGGCKMAPDPRVLLTYQVATTKANGDPEPALEYAPIPTATVRVGPLDGDLAPAAYETTDGSIAVPPALLGTTWRLEYTVDSIVNEVQWNPVEGHGRLVVPVFGRLDRTPVPANSGYKFTPTGTGAPADDVGVAVFTTGIWTNTKLHPDPFAAAKPPPFVLDFDLVQALSGRSATPEASKGDQVVVVTSQLDNSCPVSFGSTTIGSASFSPPALVGGSDTVVPNPAWATGPTRNVIATAVPAQDPFMRLGAALATRAQGAGGTIRAGRVPHDLMPLFAPPASRAARFSPDVETPMLTLANCPFAAMKTPTFVDPTQLASFPLVAQGLISDARLVNADGSGNGGSALVSSLVSVGLSPGFTIDMSIPIATGPRLSDGTTIVDLGGANDKRPLPAGTGKLELTFGFDTAGTVDYAEIGLFRVAPAGGSSQATLPTAERIYVVADVSTTRVVIDRSTLAQGVEYVFGIRTHRGRSQASEGDFRLATYPQSSATIFTRTFVVQ